MTLGDRIAVMKRGVLQQVADPFTLYSRPANQFVAGFIGSPSINFFGASVAADGKTLEAERFRMAVPAALAAGVSGLRGREVVVGVRPEDLALQPTSPGGSIPGSVTVREPLGNEVLVHWDTPVGPLVSRVPGQQAPAEGQVATLHFVEAKLHLFDPETEAALDGVA
jgi:multiple sugar transport system ATP-binding protein